MKTNVFISLTIIAVTLLTANISYALVLDFSEYENPGGSTYNQIGSYSKDGFNITTSGNALVALQPPHTYSFGSVVLLIRNPNELARLSSSNGLFTINSIDVHRTVREPFNNMDETITFTAYNSINNVMGAMPYTFNDYDWHKVVFDSSFQNIASLEWQQIYPYHVFDNIVLSIIPEPATLSLLGLGLLGSKALKKRKQLN